MVIVTIVIDSFTCLLICLFVFVLSVSTNRLVEITNHFFSVHSVKQQKKNSEKEFSISAEKRQPRVPLEKPSSRSNASSRQ